MNIYVSNIAYNATDELLQEAFGAFGEVQSARIIKDRMTGRSRGFGFVEMPNDEQGRAALEGVNGVDMLGRRINAREAKPREEGSNTPRQPGQQGQGGGFRPREPRPQPQVINRGVY